MFFAHSSPSQHLETSQHLLNKKSSTFLKLTNMPPPPWWEDVGAGVRQGDLAAPDVQHLQHGLPVQLVPGKGQSFYEGEAEDGEGHDRQGDGKDHTPEGKSWWGSCQRSLWRLARVRSTWVCRPGCQAQWQGKERWARGGAARRSTPPASTTSAHGWTISCGCFWRGCYWFLGSPWSGGESTSRRGQNSWCASQFLGSRRRCTAVYTTALEDSSRPTEGIFQYTFISYFSSAITVFALWSQKRISLPHPRSHPMRKMSELEKANFGLKQISVTIFPSHNFVQLCKDISCLKLLFA